ncbi:YoaK family protein [Streptacidiphilus rugosus]|uniref:YoaK family protein n=1 Tax=Streptacidiphilus rugosus TaxID=405783 RepID=UPI00069165F4|nr:YoaK family protein [Streptacidiphilus rugosus]
MSVDLNRAEIRISVVMLSLTLSAGAIDAITYLGLGHAFAALTTGNMLLLGFGVAQTAGTPIARPAEALAAFAAGVALAHTLIARLDRRGRRWFVAGLAFEVFLLAAAGLYAVGVAGSGPLAGRGQAVTVVLLAAAMGWRQRVMLEAGIPDMPTTVLQMTLVKAVTDVLSGSFPGPAGTRLAKARRIATIVGLFAGGAAGALLLRLGPGPALLCIAGFEACVAALYAHSPRYRPPTPAAGATTG